MSTGRTLELSCSTALIVIFLFSCALSSSEENRARERIGARIESVGAGPVLREIFSRPDWDTVLDGMRTGDIGWLRIGTALKKVSDAGASEELRITVAKALSVNPKNVFLADSSLSDSAQIQWLCQTTGIEKPIQEEVLELNARIDALRKVQGSPYQHMKRICIESAEKVKGYLLERQDRD